MLVSFLRVMIPGYCIRQVGAISEGIGVRASKEALSFKICSASSLSFSVQTFFHVLV